MLHYDADDPRYTYDRLWHARLGSGWVAVRRDRVHPRLWHVVGVSLCGRHYRNRRRMSDILEGLGLIVRSIPKPHLFVSWTPLAGRPGPRDGQMRLGFGSVGR